MIAMVIMGLLCTRMAIEQADGSLVPDACKFEVFDHSQCDACACLPVLTPAPASTTRPDKRYKRCTLAW